MKIKKQLIFIWFLLVLLISGCSFVRIQNVSDVRVYMSVRVPDSGKSYTRIIRPGQVVDVFSSHGGRYTVTVVPNERYETFLLDLQNQITKRLFEERATLTGEEVARLTQRLNEADQLLKELEEPGASCSGYLPDFDTAVAVVVFDLSQNDFVLK